MVVDGLLITALQIIYNTEFAQRSGLGKPVAGVAGERKGLLEVVGALLVAALQVVEDADAGQHAGFGGHR